MILFIHILKTAGTTLREEIIEKNYKQKEIGYYYGYTPEEMQWNMQNPPKDK